MAHETPLISTIVVGLVLAFAFGALANRLRLSPLVGYLLAGVCVGPFTPGFVADQTLANDLAEIGVILLMFGVGLHFTPNELLAVRGIAVPGAVAQIVVATLLGMALAYILGWSLAAGLIFGLALSVASTVVLLRALQERRLVETERGRIAVGWLVVEDFVMVLTLVLLPALAGALKGDHAGFLSAAPPMLITVAKAAIFVGLMLVVGKRIIPATLHWVAHSGSRELFRLCVLAIALGVAFGASAFFGVSFALGAFFAGMILSESELSQRAASETLPLRDAFAVLFFVSVGMLVDPGTVIREIWPLAATVLIIIVGKSLAAFLIVRLSGYSTATALTISASLAQIGEFSFILAGLGVALDLLPARGRDLILAGAILSILINPLLFSALDRFLAPEADSEAAGPDGAPAVHEPVQQTSLDRHIVLVGHGRVGGVVRLGLTGGAPVLVVEVDAGKVAQLKAENVDAIAGNAADPKIIRAAALERARCLIVAIPEAFEAGQIVEQARAASSNLLIIARAHSEQEIAYLRERGASLVVMGEYEIAKAMLVAVGPAGHARET